MTTASQVKARSWLPLLSALGFLLFWAAVTYHLCLRRTGGSYVYPLDDAYIHMSIAKNLVRHGLWGVTAYHFSSASSSILWPLLVAVIFKVVGVQVLVPLFLSLSCGLLLLVVADRCIRAQSSAPPWLRTLALFALIFFTPLVSNCFTGMEHLAHACAAVLYCATVVDLAAGRRDRRSAIAFVLLSALLVAVRYEAVAMIGMGCLILVLSRRWLLAVASAVAAALPIVAFGEYATAHGAYFLPNSVLLKSGGGLVNRLMGNATSAHILILLLSLALLLYLASILAGSTTQTGSQTGSQTGTQTSPQTTLGALATGSAARPRLWLLLFIGSSILHLAGGRVNWYFRYEAYLNAVGVVALTIASAWLLRSELWARSAAQWTPRRLVLALPAVPLIFILAMPALKMVARGFTSVPRVSSERYLEHVQPAMFLATYYPRSTVALNDIGAACFFTDANVLDVFGLASIEPIQFRKRDGYKADDLRDWAAREGAKVAILQIDWLDVGDRVPKEWVQVADWKFPSNLVFDDLRVAVFAINPSDAPVLRQQLSEFQKRAPAALELSLLNEGTRENPKPVRSTDDPR
ncbi:MAG TPA: hypothetical protein VGD59_05255 [Acidisarcina sp.]